MEERLTCTVTLREASRTTPAMPPAKRLRVKLRQHNGQQRALVAAHQVVRNAVACMTRKDLGPRHVYMAHAKQL